MQVLFVIEESKGTEIDHKEYLHQLADNTSTVNEFLQLIRNSKHKDLFFSSDQAKKHKDLLDPANLAHPAQRNPPRHFNKSNSKQTKQLNDKPATSDTAPPTHPQGTLRNLVGTAQTATPLATIPNLHKLQNALPIIDVHIANDMETSPSLPALLDSGATHPVISSNIVQNLLLPTYCCADQPWFDIRTFREDEVETIVHRLTSLKFTFNGKAYVKEFVVYPSAADRSKSIQASLLNYPTTARPSSPRTSWQQLSRTMSTLHYPYHQLVQTTTSFVSHNHLRHFHLVIP